MRRHWAALCAALAVAGCSTAPDETPQRVLSDDYRTVPLDKVAAAAELTFPDGTVLAAGWYYYWQEWQLSARLTMPRTALEDFVVGNRLPAPTAEAVDADTFGNLPSKRDGGWRPAAAQRVEGIASQGLTKEAGASRELLFQLDDLTTVTVYLVVNDT